MHQPCRRRRDARLNAPRQRTRRSRPHPTNCHRLLLHARAGAALALFGAAWAERVRWFVASGSARPL